MRRLRRKRQGSSPEWAETPANVLSAVEKVMRGSGRNAPRARPKGDAPDHTHRLLWYAFRAALGSARTWAPRNVFASGIETDSMPTIMLPD